MGATRADVPGWRLAQGACGVSKALGSTSLGAGERSCERGLSALPDHLGMHVCILPTLTGALGPASHNLSADENVNVDVDAAEEVDFKDVSQEKAFEILNCTHEGLTSAEAEKRLEQYGPNKLPEGSRNALLVYLGYMWNPLSWAMEAAAIIAIALLDYVDFALIIALLLCNATISYVEESNADKAIKALTSALAPKAKVIRDGEVRALSWIVVWWDIFTMTCCMI
jgi:magnesium-transporting ATPase (P-type)